MKLLRKARVITTQNVLKLREARDAADAVKIAKAEANEAKKKAKEDSSILDKPWRGRCRQVKLSENVTAYSIETWKNEKENQDKEKWVNIVEILTSQVPRCSGMHQDTY